MSYQLPRSPQTLAGTITKAMHALMLSRSGILGAVRSLERDAEHGAVSYLKTAVSAMSTGNTSELLSHPATIAFMQSLSAAGLFDAVRVNSLQVPLGSRVVWPVTTINGGSTDEGKPKPISSAAVEAPALPPSKATAQIVATAELLKTPNAHDWLNAELRSGAAEAADAKALALLIAGASSAAASGTSETAFRTDFGGRLAVLGPNLGNGSHVVVAASPTQMAQLPLFDGAFFAELGITGGTAGGMQFVASSALGTNIVVVDAAQVTVAGSEPEFREGPHASIEMVDTPTDPVAAATVTVSAFQHNLLPLLVERFFTLAARPGSVAMITSCNYHA
jgi:hypothetical protein